MGKFLYPLPESCYNNTGDGVHWHGAKSYSGHGVGKLDLAAPAGTPVRAMTDGYVLKANKDRSSPFYESCDILVESGYKGTPFVIRYYHIDNYTHKVGDFVTQGEIIGYVGDRAVSGKHLHLDICKYENGAYRAGNQVPTYAPVKNSDQIEAFKIWTKQAGRDYSARCWEIIATSAKYYQPGASQSTSSSVYESTKGNDNQQAVDFYFNGTIGQGFAGPYPDTLERLNSESCRGLRIVVQSCLGEFGAWKFAAATYAKLYRATIIGNEFINSNGPRTRTNLLDWLNDVNYRSHSGWMGTKNRGDKMFSESQLSFAQAVYNNLVKPKIYGEEFHNGSQEFKNAIIKACNGIPLHNGCVGNTWADKPIFAVLFDTKRNIDEGTGGQPRLGVYLMYRGKNSFTIFNDNVLR